jgi:UDP-GlcNAc:undecaprenyl-phosphate/decaprenyl-phosphate GlcNAc-1-phosphate transferase
MSLSLGSINGFPIEYYLLSFLTALIAVLLSIPFVKNLALKYGCIDAPSARKVHQVPIPRLGGISIFAGTALALGLAWLTGAFNFVAPEMQTDTLTICWGSACFFLIGLLDDLLGLPAIGRLVMQLGIASLVWLAGVRIEFLTIPGLGLTPIEWLSLPITVLWFTGVVNAINWIDGLDGLASGVSGIAAIVSFIICLYTGQPLAALIGLTLSGSLFGFLFYNFNPARIFMGDGGSYFIGFLLAGVGLVKGVTATAIFLPLIILAVPLLDMSVVILARLYRGHSPFVADKRHLHHRLLETGLSHRSVVLVIYALTLWAGSLAIILVGIPSSPMILGGATGLLGFMTWKAWHSIR